MGLLVSWVGAWLIYPQLSWAWTDFTPGYRWSRSVSRVCLLPWISNQPGHMFLMAMAKAPGVKTNHSSTLPISSLLTALTKTSHIASSIEEGWGAHVTHPDVMVIVGLQYYDRGMQNWGEAVQYRQSTWQGMGLFQSESPCQPERD